MEHKKRFKDLIIEDKSDEIGMIALQGPLTKRCWKRSSLKVTPNFLIPGGTVLGFVR